MSTLKVNAIKNTSDVEMYLCKAWVNFNGTGTVAIRASGNVSSITDNGTGDYTVNFTTAMADTNYCPQLTSIGVSLTDITRIFVVAGVQATGATTKTTAALRVLYGAADASLIQDSAELNVAIFR